MEYDLFFKDTKPKMEDVARGSQASNKLYHYFENPIFTMSIFKSLVLRKKTEWVNKRKISRLVDYLVILEIFLHTKRALA